MLLLRIAVAAAYVLLAAGCGGGDPTDAEASHASVGTPVAGMTPFVASVRLAGVDVARLSGAAFVIEPKLGATAAPVQASFDAAWLRRSNRSSVADGTIVLPLFGLYSGWNNQVTLKLAFEDGSVQVLRLSFATTAYVDPHAVYDQPVVMKGRAPSQAIGFNYFYMKSGYGPPVVVDTDGEIRWADIGTFNSQASLFADNGFYVVTGLTMRRLELDGTETVIGMISSSDVDYLRFTHNMDYGKAGLLVEPDAKIDGVDNLESMLTEIDASGQVLHEWNLAEIVSRYMTAAGDDPSTVVRPGVDWFHLNAAFYDRRDDSILVSSRENFVMKIDYASGDLKWVFGDPTKYWYQSPSLRARALTLTNDGLYPDGQHAVTITPTGELMIFDDGQPSSNPPAGGNAGEFRTFSSVATYGIDDAALTATQHWSFDYGQQIKAPFCSSAAQVADGSVLISYATADNFTHARLVGLDPQRNVVFDFQYDTTPCDTSWNAQVIPLESMRFQ